MNNSNLLQLVLKRVFLSVFIAILPLFMLSISNGEEALKPSYIKLSLGKSIGGGLSRIEGPILMTQTNPYVGKPEIMVEQIATIASGYTFRAFAFDEMDQKLDIGINWHSSDPEVILITPTVGNEVIVRGLKEGTADVIIKAGNLTKVLKAIKVTSESKFKQ